MPGPFGTGTLNPDDPKKVCPCLSVFVRASLCRPFPRDTACLAEPLGLSGRTPGGGQQHNQAEAKEQQIT